MKDTNVWGFEQETISAAELTAFLHRGNFENIITVTETLNSALNCLCSVIMRH